MKKFAVGVINFFNNDLVIEIIEADGWKDALGKHRAFIPYSIEEMNEMFPDDSQEKAKNEAFNMDMMIDVVEIK